MSIDKAEMTSLPDIPENAFLGKSEDPKTANASKKVLGDPIKVSQFDFDPNYVCTWHSLDEVLDFNEY